MKLVEGMYRHVVRKVKGVSLPDFPVLGYRNAMDRYGADKPDLRFGLELTDVSQIVKKSGFNIFRDAVSQGGVVKALFVSHEFEKKDIKRFEEICKDAGARGLVSVRFDGEKLSESHAAEPLAGVAKELVKASKLKKGWAFIVAGKWKTTCIALGKLRLELASQMNLIKNRDELSFCWVTDFPLFAWNDEERKWEPEHHIFTAPKDEHIQYLEKDPGRVEGRLFDIVLNGTELGSGSIRISNPVLQERVMAVIGMTKQEARRKFGFLLDAYDYGGPVHGGMGLGLDRLVAMLNGCSDIREVIAFPKNKAAQCPMDGSPSDVDAKQLKELHIRVELGTKAKEAEKCKEKPCSKN